MRCAMAGNGGRSRRAQGACGCAMEAVISASPGILSAESELHDRAGAMYYRILLKTGELRRGWRGQVDRRTQRVPRPVLLGLPAKELALQAEGDGESDIFSPGRGGNLHADGQAGVGSAAAD